VDFEWDPAKAASNFAKHGVDFSDAMHVFDDPLMQLLVDPRAHGERRYASFSLHTR